MRTTRLRINSESLVFKNRVHGWLLRYLSPIFVIYRVRLRFSCAADCVEHKFNPA